MAIDTYIVKTSLNSIISLISKYGRVGTVRFGNYSYHRDLKDWGNKDAQRLGVQDLIKKIVKEQSSYGIEIDTELYAQVDVFKMFSSDPDEEATVDVTLMREDPRASEEEVADVTSSERWEKDYDTCVWL